MTISTMVKPTATQDAALLLSIAATIGSTKPFIDKVVVVLDAGELMQDSPKGNLMVSGEPDNMRANNNTSDRRSFMVILGCERRQVIK